MGNGDCMAIVNCLLYCPSSTCVQTCFDTYSGGYQTYGTLAQCDTIRTCVDCTDPCSKRAPLCIVTAPTVDGGIEQLDAGQQETPCGRCGHNKCGDALDQCTIGTECIGYVACQASTISSQFFAECGTLYPTGADNLAAVRDCLHTKCGDVCPP
jgi:hypothetical protein